MKKILLILVLIGLPQFGFSQVGINTTSPNAQLDIKSSNQATPANTDGILIPKIDAFPITNPTAAQQGMMVYLTTTSVGKQPGFYYWDNNGTPQWKGFGIGIVSIANGTTIGNTMYWDGTSWVNNSGFLFNNGTSIGVNTALPSSMLTVKKDGIGFTQVDEIGSAQIGFRTDATSTVLQTHTDDDLEFATNDGGTQMILNKTTGNLGLDVFSALEKLEANGKTKTTNLQVTNGAGLGKMLSSDSSGNANWKSANSFSWLLAGNSGINPTYNFLGTTDDKDVVFKRYNIPSGFIGATNTAFGVEALQSNTGTGNTAFGKWSLGSNIAGNNNCGFGWATFYHCTEGDQNTIFGTDAAKANKLSNSTGIGFRVLQSSSGNENTAIGDYSHAYTYDSSKNVVIGIFAYSRSSFDNGGVGYDGNNVAVGYNTNQDTQNTLTTNGINNTVLGSYALSTNGTGNNNTALGNNAMIANTAETNNIVIGANTTIPVVGNDNQLSVANVFYGAGLNTLNSSYFSFGALPSNKYKLYCNSYQLTATGDGQFGLFGYRDRDTRNDGSTYNYTDTNGAIGGRNYWGDSYTFGVAGHSNNQFFRSGGILGSNTSGTYWSALGYNNSAGTTYGIYATAALTTGAGRLTQPQSQFSIGGGFYGGLLGSWSKGEVIGEVNSGRMISNYNSGDEYTHGKQIEIVDTGSTNTAAYTATSTENIVYSKGKIKLFNGVARVNFSADYSGLLNDVPEITMTAMGQCNGIYMESIDKNGFIVKELNNGSTDVAVSWIAVGDRIDDSKVSSIVLEPNFDVSINEMMFNENNLNESAKAIWSENNTLRFGALPNSLKTEMKKE